MFAEIHLQSYMQSYIQGKILLAVKDFTVQ